MGSPMDAAGLYAQGGGAGAFAADPQSWQLYTQALQQQQQQQQQQQVSHGPILQGGDGGRSGGAGGGNGGGYGSPHAAQGDTWAALYAPPRTGG